MSQLVPVDRPAPPAIIVPGVGRVTVPATIAQAGELAVRRYIAFMTAGIGNRNTRAAYARAASAFFAWCDGFGLALAAIEPVHVAAWVETMKDKIDAPNPKDRLSVPTIKQRLAAVRALFDALVVGWVVPINPAAAVRGPSYSAKVGKTVVLDPSEARQLFDAIDTTTPIGLRDRALIALMVYSFARVSAALGMNVEDAFTKNRRLWVRLNEKGGKRHEMPCHHNLEAYLHAYIDECGLGNEPKGALFRTIQRGTGWLSATRLPRQNAFDLVRRRAEAAGIETAIGNHTFRATGITAYLKNGGTLEKAASMANHASTRTTQLYDRRHEEASLDEVERVVI